MGTAYHRPIMIWSVCHRLYDHRPSSPLYSDSAINEHSMLSMGVIGSQCDRSWKGAHSESPIESGRLGDSNLKYTVLCPSFTILISDRLEVHFNEATFGSLPMGLCPVPLVFRNEQFSRNSDFKFSHCKFSILKRPLAAVMLAFQTVFQIKANFPKIDKNRTL